MTAVAIAMAQDGIKNKPDVEIMEDGNGEEEEQEVEEERRDQSGQMEAMSMAVMAENEVSPTSWNKEREGISQAAVQQSAAAALRMIVDCD